MGPGQARDTTGKRTRAHTHGCKTGCPLEPWKWVEVVSRCLRWFGGLGVATQHRRASAAGKCSTAVHCIECMPPSDMMCTLLAPPPTSHALLGSCMTGVCNTVAQPLDHFSVGSAPQLGCSVCNAQPTSSPKRLTLLCDGYGVKVKPTCTQGITVQQSSQVRTCVDRLHPLTQPDYSHIRAEYILPECVQQCSDHFASPTLFEHQRTQRLSPSPTESGGRGEST